MSRLWRSAVAAFGAILVLAAAAAEPDDGHVPAPVAEPVAPAEAEALYRELSQQMADAYALSGDATARDYLAWRRHNSAPYRSQTHGERYVNNYANDRAADYPAVALGGGTMPPGAVLAKDSFTIVEGYEVFPAALFIMQKLWPGISPETGDWRYAMILPDGTFFGDSRGTNAGQVAYCHDCHRSRADRDHLFFLPQRYRAGGDGR